MPPSPAQRGRPAARPPFAALAVVATLAMAAITSVVALADAVNHISGVPVTRSVTSVALPDPVGAAPVPAVVAAPTAPVAPPAPVPARAAVAAPSGSATVSLPAASAGSARIDEELKEPEERAAAAPTQPEPEQEEPAAEVLAAPAPAAEEPAEDRVEAKAAPPKPPSPSPTQECKPSDGRLDVDLRRDEAGRVTMLAISGLPVPCVEIPVRLVLDMKGDAPDIAVTIRVTEDRTLVFEPDEPLHPRDVQAVRVEPVRG